MTVLFWLGLLYLAYECDRLRKRVSTLEKERTRDQR